MSATCVYSANAASIAALACGLHVWIDIADRAQALSRMANQELSYHV